MGLTSFTVTSFLAVAGVGVSWYTRATPTCHCVCGGDDGALKVLRETLSRCGPESLAARPCPPCPPAQEQPDHFLTILCGAFAFGFIVGAVSILIYIALNTHRTADDWTQQQRPHSPSSGVSSALALDDGLRPRWTPPVGSSARRI